MDKNKNLKPNTTEEKKKRFLELFLKNKAMIALTCKEAGFSRQSYYYWVNPENDRYDAEFTEKVKDLMEQAKDSVECKLLELIDAGDTPSTIFYCKTKLKDRGYIERIDNVSSDRSMSQISAEDQSILDRMRDK